MIKHWLSSIDRNKKITVNYEGFCDGPKKIYEELVLKLKSQGYKCSEVYSGKNKFKMSRIPSDNKVIIDAYNKFFK